jgi:exodeoxyribonuclease VII large subunit
MQRDLPELAGVVRVTGYLTEPGKSRGTWHYAVKIVGEGGAQIKADLPASMVSTRQVTAGSPVRVTGTLKLEATNYGLDARLVVGDIELVGASGTEVTAAAPGKASIDLLKSLPCRRYPFPSLNDLTISLIQSSSVASQVGSDCQSELDKIADYVRVLPIHVNILDPEAIAQAIAQAPGSVIMLIRGGGDAADFEVFDHPSVVRALAQKQAFRIVGLGHTGNSTLLDLVADISANTPAQAGQFVREIVEGRLRQHANIQDRIRILERERDDAIRRGAVSGYPWWAIVIALLAGVLAGVLLR